MGKPTPKLGESVYKSTYTTEFPSYLKARGVSSSPAEGEGGEAGNKGMADEPNAVDFESFAKSGLVPVLVVSTFFENNGAGSTAGASSFF